MVSTSRLSQIRRNLLHWFDKNRRDLPWRRTRDPYAIWVAETMLQQTQVKTVLPYYLRFLTAFPTLACLDRAPKERVLALWSGLGYYRRAESLKKAVRKIVREHGGQLPQDFHALRQLPGVGPYTAGALMSIAFNKPYPALDGNARRVLRRLFNITSERELQETAGRLVSPSRPGEFNQALMELGSNICLSRNPACPLCPLASCCVAKSTGRLAPQRESTQSRKKKNVEWPLALIHNNGRILLRRRPQGGMLGGLWEIPGGEAKRGETARLTLAHHLKGLGHQLRPALEIGAIRHSITHRKIRAPLFAISGSKGFRLPDPGWRWVRLSSLRRYPLSSLSLKAVRLFTECWESPASELFKVHSDGLLQSPVGGSRLDRKISARGQQTPTGPMWSPTASQPWPPPQRFVGRNPPKRILLRQGYGGYPHSSPPSRAGLSPLRGGG